MILAVLVLPGSYVILYAVLEEIIATEVQQFDLDCIFILRELLAIASTTKSESQAYFLLASNPNKLINRIGKKAFIEQNLNPALKIEVISTLLKKIEHSNVSDYLQTIFLNWKSNHSEIAAYTKNFQKLMQTKLDEDFHNLESKTTVLNSIIGIFPIFTVFLIFIGFKNIHPLFEILITLFFVILLLIYFIDPFRMQPILQFFGSNDQIEASNGSGMLQDFLSLLLQNQNFSKSLQNLIMQSKNKRKGRNNDVLVFLNFTESANNNIKMITSLTKNSGSKLHNLFILINEIQKIDFNFMLEQFPDFIANYSSIEQYYRKKYLFLKTEAKKSYLLILINSFSLGILSVILPYLLIITSINFSTLQNIPRAIQNPGINLLTSFEFMLLICILYLSYFLGYTVHSRKTLLKNLCTNVTLFLAGFLFSIVLLRPVLTII